MNAVIVEDDPRVRTSLERTLKANGYSVTAYAAGAPALADVLSVSPDVIVLDVNLPDLDGFEVCRQLRRRGDRTPVLMLTARDAVEDRVAGLDAGADDYLVKPFALTELMARLRALGRRSSAALDGPDSAPLGYADLTIDPESCSATRGDRTFDLTRTEFLLLELFVRNPERVMSRETILDRVWGMDARTSSNGVEVYVGYLRRKLEAGGEGRLLQTVRGFGYRLQQTPE